MKSNLLSASLLLSLLLTACATGPGDDLSCPECDNVTELLVGDKCVPIEEVEPCGPDGHLHGDACHCFSEQMPTTIGDEDYCLQPDCAEVTVDLDAAACEELAKTPELVTPASAFEDFDAAHLDKGVPLEISLPAQGSGYAHFAGDMSGEVAVYLDRAGAIVGFFDEAGQAINAADMGANPDCPEASLQVWHVEISNDSGSPIPIVVEFAGEGLANPTLVIYDMEADDHEH